MRTARKAVAAVELECPYCGEAIAAPGGSLFWPVAEMPEAGEPIECRGCGKESKAPRV